MPLPSTNTPWPPKALQHILPTLGEWSAWYSGDADRLSAVYGGRTGQDPSGTGFFASEHGGFKATVGRAFTRWFWGEPTRGPDRRTKLHVPIAADLCQASADLLFADEITLATDDQRAQARLEELAADGMYATLAEGAEVAAGLGGVYLKVAWDDKVADHPFICTVDADQAWPEFRYGRLVAVTFWQVVHREGDKTWRHLERHELDGTGNGVILHGLYEGTVDELGHVVPLTEQPATADLALTVTDGNVVHTRSKGLAVTYAPNQRPQRKWRTDPLGRWLGRPDLDELEPMMDQLDEAYSSWMRDLRLGKARILAARQLLESQGRGKGAAFDLDQEIYAPLEKLGSQAGAAGGSGMPIEQVQFKIRADEHAATVDRLVSDIVRTAGYSAQTFGEDAGDVAQRTATEVGSRDRRSAMTRDRKIRNWRRPVAYIAEKLLAVDQAVFATRVAPGDVTVKWPDGVQETQLQIAQTAAALQAARAASIETIVRMVQPDLDDTQVETEVARIKAEDGTHVSNPADFDGIAGA